MGFSVSGRRQVSGRIRSYMLSEYSMSLTGIHPPGRTEILPNLLVWTEIGGEDSNQGSRDDAAVYL